MTAVSGPASRPGLVERVAGNPRARVCVGVAAAGLVLGWMIPLNDDVGLGRVIGAVMVGLIFIVAGLAAARNRPDSPVWALLIAFAVVGILGEARLESLVPWRYTVGIAFDGLAVALLAYLLLAFPSGRLTGWWSRGLAAATFVVTLGWKPFELLWSPPGAFCSTCAPAGNLLFAGPGPLDLDRVDGVLETVVAVLVGLVLATLVMRLIRASPPRRRVLAPVLLPSVALTAKLMADELWLRERFVVYPSDEFLLILAINTILFGAVAAGVLVGLQRMQSARSSVAQLVVDLGRLPESGTLRSLLASGLGDPSLRVGFWAEPFERYVDPDGMPLDLPAPAEDRVATFVAGEHGPLAVLVHDRALLENARLVEAVVAAARFALENERLKAEVRAQLEEVSRSRARIVSAGDAQRRRIERDLHDGAQQRLVLLAMSLQLVEAQLDQGSGDRELRDLVAEAQDQAGKAIEELRDLARGIHPPILTEEGLSAALRSLADRAPVRVVLGRLPEGRFATEVEVAAYYVCSEAITNAAKHARADCVQMEAGVNDDRLTIVIADDGCGGATMNGGTGLLGLSDRVEAAGGHLRLESPTGQGTRISVELPVTARSAEPGLSGSRAPAAGAA